MSKGIVYVVMAKRYYDVDGTHDVFPVKEFAQHAHATAWCRQEDMQIEYDGLYVLKVPFASSEHQKLSRQLVSP